jgi:hypothetical protein
MSKAQAEWQKVFKFAVSVANSKRKANPNLTYPQAMKKAWQDPKVLAKKKEYERKKGVGKTTTKKKTTTRKTTTKKKTASKSKTTKKRTSTKKR